MRNGWTDDFVSGDLKKPSWKQYLQVSEDDLMERLNRGAMSGTEASWQAEKDIIAMAMAEKSRRRWRWYHGGLMLVSVFSAAAAWASVYSC